MLRRLATLLAALALGTGALLARGGGGCLEAGTLVDTPNGPVAVERLHAGDIVWGLAGGQRIRATVQTVYAVEPESYIELAAGDATLRVTPEHPVQVAPGTFVRADHLAAGHAELFLASGRAALTATRSVRAAQPAYNLLVSPGGVFFANGLAVHNKGCFLPDTPVTLADGTRRAISAVRPGDAVLAFATDGEIVHATVRRVLTHDVESFLILRTASLELRVTEEHPFYVGDGMFKTAEALHVGENVWVYDGAALAPQPVLALERVVAAVTVFNLQTDAPHTFLANGVAVHNKGGGCFVAGTLVDTPAGPRAIETLRLGELVFAPTADGGRVPVAIEGVYLNFTPRLTLHTDRGALRTTAEHPLLGGGARPAFAAAETFAAGALLTHVDGAARVLRVERGPANEPVYTLRVAAPHAFFADGFIVHNKGGGGGGFRSSGGSRGGGGSGTPPPPWAIFLLIVGVVAIIIVAKVQEGAGADEELDFVFDRDEIQGKAAKTNELLTFIAKVDADWTPEKLRETTQATFLKLQECWAARDYAPMEALMMHDLYEEHCGQIRGLQHLHEINRLDDLRVDAIDIVHLNYTNQAAQRNFTALITATARDRYFNDETGAFLRGDDQPQQFQEFWTFQWLDGWKLREIEQTKESDVLTEENLFEQFTDAGRDQIYGATAGQTGPAGPALPDDVRTKAGKIERLLNFLVQTDKIWNRDEMLATARRVFLNVQLTWQDGRPEMVSGLAADAAMLAHLRGVIETNRQRGVRVEHRNLCVRKVEIVLVNNRDDRTQDEYTARITAHAQTIIRAADRELRHDEYVQAWTEFWTFGRDGQRWVLKEILPDAVGTGAIARENVDEGTSQQMLEWYYSKPRAN